MRIVFAFSVFFCLFSCSDAQCKLKFIPDQATKPNLARLFPSAIIDLPKGFKLISSEGHIDAWSGSMASSDDKFKIDFSGGMVESIFEKFKKKLTCTDEIKGFEFTAKVGLVRDGEKEIIIAKVFWAQFVARVRNDNEKRQFLQIVSSYRREMTATPR